MHIRVKPAAKPIGSDHPRVVWTRPGWMAGTGAACAILVVFGAGCPKAQPGPGDDWRRVRGGGETAKMIESRGQPLVVDWQPEQRGDLEVAMHEGVAVVSYTTAGLKLLKDCHIDGQYGFIGISKKEQVIRLLSEDEVKANLPLGGAGIAAQLGGELSRGAALDIAVVMVGKKRTTWEDAAKSDLHGACEGATHFVRGATIGAFAMSSGMKDRVQTVAQLFGLGVSASSATSSSLSNRDGEMKHCDDADPDSPKAPPKCAALIRLELTPLKLEGASKAAAPAKDQAPQDTKAAKAADTGDACPKGMVYSEGKCTKPTAETTHVCRYGDGQDCLTQCEKGNGDSCDTLGVMFFNGVGVQKSENKGARLFLAACEKDSASGCFHLGITLQSGTGVTKDIAKALPLYLRGCLGGEAKSCTAAGELHFFGMLGTKDLPKAAALMAKGCEGGDENGCNDLGFIVNSGVGGVTKDEAFAARLFKKACDGNVAEACSNLAYQLEFGHGVQKNLPLSAVLYQKSCAMTGRQCVWIGVSTQIGAGVTPDAAKAKGHFTKACDAGHLAACAALNVFWGERHKLDTEQLKAYVSSWSTSCSGNLERDCGSLGVLAQAVGKQELATRIAGRACVLGDEWGCALLKLLNAPRPARAPASPTMADFGM